MVATRVPYMIIQKVTPGSIDPFVSLCLCYSVCLAVSAAMFMITGKGQSIRKELKKINWTAPALGLCLVCMDVSALLMFRLGWDLSVGSVLLYVLLAIALVIVGGIFYKEKITPKLIAGIVLCIFGVIMVSDILPF
ncbi:MAG: EamA family transporter [Oscillospiraceae bacterium]